MNFYKMLEDQIEGGFEGLGDDPEISTLNLVLSMEKDKVDEMNIKVFSFGALTNSQTFFALMKVAESLDIDLSNQLDTLNLISFAMMAKEKGL